MIPSTGHSPRLALGSSSGLWRPCFWGFGGIQCPALGQKSPLPGGVGLLSLYLFNVLLVLEEGNRDPLPFLPFSKETLVP